MGQGDRLRFADIRIPVRVTIQEEAPLTSLEEQPSSRAMSKSRLSRISRQKREKSEEIQGPSRAILSFLAMPSRICPALKYRWCSRGDRKSIYLIRTFIYEVLHTLVDFRVFCEFANLSFHPKPVFKYQKTRHSYTFLSSI